MFNIQCGVLFGFCDRHFIRPSSQYSNGMTWYDLIRVQFNFLVVSCARTLPFWVASFFCIYTGCQKSTLLPAGAPLGRRATTVQAKKWCLTSAQTGGPRTTTPPGFRCSPGSRFVRGGFVVWPLPGNCHFGMICREIFRLIIEWDPFLGGSNNILQMYGNCE